MGVLAAAVEDTSPVYRVQLYSVGADFVALAYALVAIGALVLMLLVALLVVTIGRR